MIVEQAGGFTGSRRTSTASALLLSLALAITGCATATSDLNPAGSPTFSSPSASEPSASPSTAGQSAPVTYVSTSASPVTAGFTLTQPATALIKGLTVSAIIGGGAAVDMTVDTGSNGVLVSRRFVGSAATPLNPARTFSGFNYSSSGNTYSGEWMTATLDLGSPGGSDHPATTVPTLIRVVDQACIAGTCSSGGPADGVAMMGVGFDRAGGETDQDLDGPALNPFLNLTEMHTGGMPQAYIIGLDAIVLGPAAADVADFQTVPLTRNPAGTDWNAATSCIALPAGGVPPQCGTLLLDTGLSYAIVQVPDTVNPPTVPAAKTGDRPTVADGQRIQITVPGLTQPLYDFTVGGPDAPTSVQWGHNVTQHNGQPFMNISRYALTQHDYLYNSTSGQVGFRRTGIHSSATR